MPTDLPSTLLALTRAERARTAVVACTTVRWPEDDGQVLMPFIERNGSLLLLVTDEQRRFLLDSEGGCVALDAQTLGAVRLSGDFRSVAEATAREVLDQVRSCHAECLDCPGVRLSQLVRLQVDLVELRAPDGAYRRVDLDGYLRAQPDWVLALGVQVMQHVNAAHGDEVLTAASALTGLRTEQVLYAELEWIDGHGFEIGLIDESGGRRIRCEFASPVVEPDRLSLAVHDGLLQAAPPAGPLEAGEREG